MDAQLEDWRSRGRSFDYLGFEVFYRQEGTGPVLLLIHGYPFSSFDWHPIWLALTERFTVIAPDMLGMGFSAKPVEYEYSVHDHADMHEALLQQLGVSECHVLAHDIGDSVAQELLSRHEEREDGSRPYEIRSITWLNGGMFIEAYRPRLMQTLTVKTPLGGLFAKYPRLFLSDATVRPAINEVFGPNTKPSTSSAGSSARSSTTTTAAASRTRSGASSSTATTIATAGCGRCARRPCRCASSTARATPTPDVTWPTATPS